MLSNLKLFRKYSKAAFSLAELLQDVEDKEFERGRKRRGCGSPPNYRAICGSLAWRESSKSEAANIAASRLNYIGRFRVRNSGLGFPSDFGIRALGFDLSQTVCKSA